MRRVSFADADFSEGADALTRVFTGYLLPMSFTPEQLELHVAYNDIDRAASPLWFDDDGSVVAAALMGVREGRAWIGGFGVAPEYRGKGYASRLVQTMIDTACARGLRSITLEVLAENAPAIATYRNAGFATMRTLYSFETTADGAAMPPGFAYADPDELLERPDAAPPSWQRERASLCKGGVSAAVASADAYAVFRGNDAAAQVLKLDAPSAASMNALAQAVAAGRPSQRVFVLNEPQESPHCARLREAGWTERFVQYEMTKQTRRP